MMVGGGGGGSTCLPLMNRCIKKCVCSNTGDLLLLEMPYYTTVACLLSVVDTTTCNQVL